MGAAPIDGASSSGIRANTEHPYPCFPYETVFSYLLFRHSASESRDAQWRLVACSLIVSDSAVMSHHVPQYYFKLPLKIIF
jgi:hypothetical protein